MTTLTLEHWPLAKLMPYTNNPRRNDEVVAPMADAIRKMGFKVPIIALSSGEIVDGHLRLKAAQQLGLETVPVVLADDLTPTQVKAFRILINQSAHWADWDDELLRQEMQSLAETDFDLDLIGFSDTELDALLAVEDEQASTADDVVPEPEEIVITQLGDIWELGEHRILCGDATKQSDVARLMSGEKAQMVFTDPPYNVDYGKSYRNQVRGHVRPILNDDLGDGYADFLLKAFEQLLAVTDGACYIAFAIKEITMVKHAFEQAGGQYKTILIWAKNHFTLSQSDYHHQYEPILYGWCKDVKRYWSGARDCSDVWQIDRPQRSELHPTMKPVKLVEKAILNSSRRGDIVLDPFGGSGSSLIACEQTGRQARLMELDPKYVDVIIRRWQQQTDQQAIRCNDGMTFNDLLHKTEGESNEVNIRNL